MDKLPPARHRGWRWLERLLFAIGWICLGTAVASVAEGELYQLFGRWRLQAADAAAGVGESRPLAPAIAGPTAAATSAARAFPAGATRPGTPVPAIAPGAVLGTIAIPEAGLDAVILEGVDDQTLRRGVGHFPGTPLPGFGGNSAFAGHRDTFFRGLRSVVVGQRVTFTGADGRRLAYRVASTEVVEPTRVDVLEDAGHDALTLITCYPFRYVGPAPQRFVVRCLPESGGS